LNIREKVVKEQDIGSSDGEEGVENAKNAVGFLDEEFLIGIGKCENN
jgi:hypothetical protein